MNKDNIPGLEKQYQDKQKKVDLKGHYVYDVILKYIEKNLNKYKNINHKCCALIYIHMHDKGIRNNII